MPRKSKKSKSKSKRMSKKQAEYLSSSDEEDEVCTMQNGKLWCRKRTSKNKTKTMSPPPYRSRSKSRSSSSSDTDTDTDETTSEEDGERNNSRNLYRAIGRHKNGKRKPRKKVGVSIEPKLARTHVDLVQPGPNFSSFRTSDVELAKRAMGYKDTTLEKDLYSLYLQAKPFEYTTGERRGTGRVNLLNRGSQSESSETSSSESDSDSDSDYSE